jgi:hypothetical protein
MTRTWLGTDPPDPLESVQLFHLPLKLPLKLPLPVLAPFRWLLLASRGQLDSCLLDGGSMRTSLLSSAILSLGVTLAACRSAPRGATADDARVDGACRAEIEGANLSNWKEVNADGFAFCVPADWDVRGRFAERGTALVEWNVGVPPQVGNEPKLGTGEVRPRGAIGTDPANPTESFRLTETIDGRRAELFREALASTNTTALAPLYLTGAQWLGPTLHFRGRAINLSESEEQFLIYRSVRFGSH